MEHDETILTHGTLATDTTTAESGVEVLIRLLEAKWGVPQETQQVEAISQYIDWHRQSGESLNDAITRFELLRGRARTQGPIELPYRAVTWLLFTRLVLQPMIGRPSLLQCRALFQ